MGTANNALRVLFLVVFACNALSNISVSARPDVYKWNVLFDAQQVQTKDSCPAKTFYFEEQLDHFGFSDQRTFKLRYLLADQFWKRKGAPIFFYTGNELDIKLLCRNSGFMWDIAPEFGAMLVFAEHRYYGKTLPLGPDTLKNVSNFEWLTTEQALADYAELITHLKATIPGASNSPVIAFGGSYGAILSAFMRITYPNVVIGAHSGSPPFYMMTGIAKCSGYLDVTTRTFEKASPQCVKNVRHSYDVMYAAVATAAGRAHLSQMFNLCTPLSTATDVGAFALMLSKMYVDYAMMDYPYPTDLLNPLPGWPVNAACEFLSKPLQGEDLLVGVSKVVNLFFNSTGSLKCLDYKNPPGGMEVYQLMYQTCTELVLPTCSDGSGMFPVVPWNLKVYSDFCYATYKVRPRPYWTLLEYKMTALETTSNIIFTNGELDPCSSGGVRQNVSDTVVAINIKDGAHHLELRSENKLDPPSVRAAREQIKTIFKSWLQHHKP